MGKSSYLDFLVQAAFALLECREELFVYRNRLRQRCPCVKTDWSKASLVPAKMGAEPSGCRSFSPPLLGCFLVRVKIYQMKRYFGLGRTYSGFFAKTYSFTGERTTSDAEVPLPRAPHSLAPAEVGCVAPGLKFRGENCAEV